ncbi:cysteine peptidase family C39 domain-containing protein [Calothrix sp. PCC 7507]|uniref:cysteine peptidase family C39 domain-containing protein n=1 Tax=Calothrix sp. PCC 7507 TaxID=99598 RepID=UPI00029EEB6C|nr:cysteine peptidase family C39 domain-containing protein [Calothrix sp. PCC 7507]AFY32104.1 Peptide-transporting ATPase [Calothrix sp. PCC 7507]
MNPSSSLRVQRELEYTSKQPSPTPKAAILKFLRMVAGDTSLASDLTKSLVLREFQLGDELTTYGLGGEIADSSNILYLVCQGRVRLLGFDATLGREVSTQLLLADQAFGADDLFCHEFLPYRAIAASAGYVAQIAVDDLKLWLQRLPNLENYLQQLALERQALIFYKTQTEWRSLTSLTLRQLLPYLKAITITAGSSLVTATSPSKGRFWLASGQLENLSATTEVLQVGESWGYPDVKVAEAIAQTDLLLYHLPIEHWESARDIAPQLFPHGCEDKEADIPLHLVDTPDSKLENNLQVSPTPTIPKVIELPPRQPRLENPVSVLATPDIDYTPQRQKPRSIFRLWRFYPFIQQQSSSDCGAACLAMISQYWGKRLSLNTLRNLARVDRLGASLQGLAAAAQTLGYDALPVRASLSKLESYSNPWIAHWQGIHYVVVWQVKGDRILIADPAIGKRWLMRSRFEASWTGYALLLDPTPQLDSLKPEQVSLDRYWQLFRHHRKLLRQIILASLLVQVLGLATPLSTQIILDQVMPVQNFWNLNIFAVCFGILGIWRIALKAQRQFLLDYLANRIDLNLIAGFVSYTLQLPLQFFASRQVEDIISRIQENRKIQLFLCRQAVSATLDMVMMVIYLGLMAYYNFSLTLVVLGWILPIVILTMGASPLLKKVSREILQASAAQNSSVVEMITGITTVKTAVAERPLRRRWEERLMNMVKARFRGQKLANKLQLISGLINHLGSTLVLWFGATLVMSGQMSLGKFVAFNMLIGNVTNPVLALVKLWDEFQEVLISLERLNDVLAAVPEENPQKPLLVMPVMQGEVQFENVSFRYDGDEECNTLQNISFKLKPHQTIGIVGQSGSGKSTLVKLLAGLYQPDSGRILIDGHDISHVSPQSLRSQLGLVPQESFLFSGTILENITLYCPDFTEEEAIAAAKLAQAHTFIQALPLGYNTQVGERGSLLSGGQRQKIAIARALMRNPGILILDEATSALDAESEHQFQQNLARISQYRTTLIISHRLSSIRHADCILVLDRGVLVEQGTHEELVAMSGLYHHLAKLQLHL